MPGHIIRMHHVGGRGGKGGFAIPKGFERDFVTVWYDADPACVEQIRRVGRDSGLQTIVFPYCISGRNGTKPFYVHYDPNTSSLRRPSREKADWYFYFRKFQHDYLFRESFRPMEKLKVKTFTLDELVKHRKVPPPDFLTLDTQGTEYDILSGARKVLRDNVLGLIIEVEFHELYKGQKLFGDICNLLQKKGFWFVRFNKYILEYSPYRYPIGIRGDGLQSATDAVFLKKPDAVLDTGSSAAKASLLEKLAFFAITFNQFEFAVRCMEMCASIGTQKNSTDRILRYQRFVRKFYSLSEKVLKRYPPTFGEVFTFKESKARFRKDAKIGGKDRSAEGLDALKKSADSDIEKLFRSYGFTSQADLMKRIRCQGEAALRRFIS